MLPASASVLRRTRPGASVSTLLLSQRKPGPRARRRSSASPLKGRPRQSYSRTVVLSSGVSSTSPSCVVWPPSTSNSSVRKGSKPACVSCSVQGPSWSCSRRAEPSGPVRKTRPPRRSPVRGWMRARKVVAGSASPSVRRAVMLIAPTARISGSEAGGGIAGRGLPRARGRGGGLQGLDGDRDRLALAACARRARRERPEVGRLARARAQDVGVDPDRLAGGDGQLEDARLRREQHLGPHAQATALAAAGAGAAFGWGQAHGQVERVRTGRRGRVERFRVHGGAHPQARRAGEGDRAWLPATQRSLHVLHVALVVGSHDVEALDRLGPAGGLEHERAVGPGARPRLDPASVVELGDQEHLPQGPQALARLLHGKHARCLGRGRRSVDHRAGLVAQLHPEQATRLQLEVETLAHLARLKRGLVEGLQVSVRRPHEQLAPERSHVELVRAVLRADDLALEHDEPRRTGRDDPGRVVDLGVEQAQVGLGHAAALRVGADQGAADRRAVRVENASLPARRAFEHQLTDLERRPVPHLPRRAGAAAGAPHAQRHRQPGLGSRLAVDDPDALRDRAHGFHREAALGVRARRGLGGRPGVPALEPDVDCGDGGARVVDHASRNATPRRRAQLERDALAVRQPGGREGLGPGRTALALHHDQILRQGLEPRFAALVGARARQQPFASALAEGDQPVAGKGRAAFVEHAHQQAAAARDRDLAGDSGRVGAEGAGRDAGESVFGDRSLLGVTAGQGGEQEQRARAAFGSSVHRAAAKGAPPGGQCACEMLFS